ILCSMLVFAPAVAPEASAEEGITFCDTSAGETKWLSVYDAVEEGVIAPPRVGPPYYFFPPYVEGECKTAEPSVAPSVAPSAPPSAAPSVVTSAAPSAPPSDSPSITPSAAPSALPSVAPSLAPSVAPSAVPSVAPNPTDRPDRPSPSAAPA